MYLIIVLRVHLLKATFECLSLTPGRSCFLYFLTSSAGTHCSDLVKIAHFVLFELIFSGLFLSQEVARCAYFHVVGTFIP